MNLEDVSYNFPQHNEMYRRLSLFLELLIVYNLFSLVQNFSDNE